KSWLWHRLIYYKRSSYTFKWRNFRRFGVRRKDNLFAEPTKFEVKDLHIKRVFYLIDDNRIDLKINEKLLTYAEIASEILVFQSGETALDQITSQGPLSDYAVILLDIQMPHMTGFQFVEAFKTLPLSIQKG